jgi:hypothetical protein
MRRLVLLLCLLANISYSLMPFGTLHAHINDSHHGDHVHAGHYHDLDTGTQAAADSAAVDLQLIAADRGSIDWTHWLPLLIALVVLFSAYQVVSQLLRPPRKENLPSLLRAHRLPPLRGPPLASI